MATHDFEPMHFRSTSGSHEPVLRVGSGDTIRTWCVASNGRNYGLDYRAGSVPLASASGPTSGT